MVVTLHIMKVPKSYFLEFLENFEIQAFKITSLIKMIGDDVGVKIIDGTINILMVLYVFQKFLI